MTSYELLFLTVSKVKQSVCLLSMYSGILFLTVDVSVADDLSLLVV